MGTKDDDDELLDEKQVSRILGITVRTLQQRRYLKLPPTAIRLPGMRAVRYRRSVIREFIESGKELV